MMDGAVGTPGQIMSRRRECAFDPTRDPMGTPCELRPDGGHVLDLTSSWVSHLPLDHTYHVIGTT